MAKSLVIGANGFIGSHLTDSLVGSGHDVRAFDRFRALGEPTFSATNVEIFRGEFLSRTDLDSAVQGVDYVFHFLSTTSPATAESDPTLDIRTNVAQTVELLESCVSAGVKRFFFASTGGAIYGPQGKPVYREIDRALPVSPYGIGKLTIEHYLRYFGAMHGLKSTILRISNPYGTRQHPNKRQGFIPIALRQIALGLPVVQIGDGSMVRDYIFVEDAVAMINSIVAKHSSDFDMYNIGSGKGTAVSEILECLRQVTATDFAVDVRPQPPTFVDRVVLDTDRFTREFGRPSFTELHDGVTRTYTEVLAGLNG